MPTKTLPDDQHFWQDEPAAGYTAAATEPKFMAQFAKGYSTLLSILVVASIVLAPAAFLARISPPLALPYLLYVGLMVYALVVSMRKQREALAKVQQTQERARSLTHASAIGSAIHVAGHPLLAREQAVVLALRGDVLSILNYDTGNPIDSFAVTQLQAVHTVVYDDEQVPHIDVIDSGARALLLTFDQADHAREFLLRRMRPLRPIDWYHAIEQARLLPHGGG